FQPAIDEPSNPFPSSKKDSSTMRVGTVTCCSLPLVSVKRRSTNLTSFSLISFSTSAAVVMQAPRNSVRRNERQPVARRAGQPIGVRENNAETMPAHLSSAHLPPPVHSTPKGSVLCPSIVRSARAAHFYGADFG